MCRGPWKKCYTGVDHILTKCAREYITSLSHATGVKMLPMGHTVYVDSLFYKTRSGSLIWTQHRRSLEDLAHILLWALDQRLCLEEG